MNKDPVKILYEQMDEAGIQKARDHHRPVQRFRASEARNCMRQVWYRLSGYRPAPRDARGLMYGVCGDLDHDLTRQMLKHYGIPINGVTFLEDGGVDEGPIIVEEFDVMIPETDETIKVVVSCRPDGFIPIPDIEDDEAVLEIKGIGYYQFYWLQKAFCKDGHEGALERVHEKHEGHLWQTMATMKLTRSKNTYLLYKDRSSGQLGLYNDETGERSGIYVPFEPKIWEEILQRWAFVKRCLEDGEAPQPEFSDGSNQCNYCAFHYMCHGAEERRQREQTPIILYPGPQMDYHLEDFTPTPELDDANTVDDRTA